MNLLEVFAFVANVFSTDTLLSKTGSVNVYKSLLSVSLVVLLSEQLTDIL